MVTLSPSWMLRVCRFCSPCWLFTSRQEHKDRGQESVTAFSLTSVCISFHNLRVHFPINRLSWWHSGKESACNAGDVALIPGSGRSPGEGMATHSSILAWKIPWTEESGGLQPTGSQRVRRDLATEHHHTYKNTLN